MAAHNPNIDLPDDATLNRCWTKNPDGGGFAYIKNDKIYIYRTLDRNKFIDKLKKHRGDNMNAPFIWHMRAASHGVVSLENTHPFKVNEGLVFAHNGHISKCDTSKISKISDTNNFNNIIMKKLPIEVVLSRDFDWLVRPYIAHSKLLLLSKAEGIQIIAKEKGEVKDGIWYSNTMYQETKPYYSTHMDRTIPSKTHKCINCKVEKGYLETIVYNYEGYAYIAKLCWSCWNNLTKKYSFEQVLPRTSAYVDMSYKCYECNDYVGVNSTIVVDALSGQFKKVCAKCFIESYFGETIHATETLVDVLDFMDIIDCADGVEADKDKEKAA